MDLQSTAESQASKAAVSASVFLSQVSVGSKQENFHFHSGADIINACCSIFFAVVDSYKFSTWDFLGLSRNSEMKFWIQRFESCDLRLYDLTLLLIFEGRHVNFFFVSSQWIFPSALIHQFAKLERKH